MKRKLLFIHSLGPHSHLRAEVQDHLRHSKRKILFPDVTETTENNYSLSLHKEKVPFKPGHSSVPVYCVMTNGQEGKNSQTGFTTANHGAYSLSQRWAPLRCINTKQLTHYSTPLPAQPASHSLLSLSLHQTEVIWATCPSHVCFASSFIQAFDMPQRGETIFCRIQYTPLTFLLQLFHHVSCHWEKLTMELLNAAC